MFLLLVYDCFDFLNRDNYFSRLVVGISMHFIQRQNNKCIHLTLDAKFIKIEKL